MKNYYHILGIERNATLTEIKKAYRKKAIMYHPDKHMGDDIYKDLFYEIKEAYDILSNENTRKTYDEKFNFYFEQSQEFETSKEDEIKEEKETFHYYSQQPFFSEQDRLINDTPQFTPKFDYWGNQISENIDFFKLPQKIGKIIAGFSTLHKKDTPQTKKEKTGCIFQAIGISIGISLLIIWIFNVSNPIALAVWFIIPLIIILAFAVQSTKFEHTCTYIGVNGFAEYKCAKKRDNIISSTEINFNQVTDFIKFTVINKLNFTYQNTSYSFYWLNKESVVKKYEGTHTDKKGEPDKEIFADYWLNIYAEKYWTIYLLDNMEKQIEIVGYLVFNIYHFENNQWVRTPFIHLGVGYIKFIAENEDILYEFDKIKRFTQKGITFL